MVISARSKLRALIQLYRIVLGRTADPDGLTNYAEAMRRGVPLADLADEFAGSAEFLTRWPTGAIDSVAFIRLLYAAATGQASADALFVRHGGAIERARGFGSKIAALIDRAPMISSPNGVAGTVLNTPEGYAGWIAWNEPDTIQPPSTVSPMVSLVLLLDGPARRLPQTLASAFAQTHTNLEIIALGWPSLGALARLVRAGQSERRLRWCAAPNGGSMVDHLARAVAACRGAYVGLLMPGDRLAPDALAQWMGAARDEPALIYADEDLTDAGGRRRSPWFKTDWDPDAAPVLDQIGRGWLARTSALQAVIDQTLSSDDWRHDLMLRLHERFSSARFVRVPGVLFHGFETSREPAAGARIATARAHLSRAGMDRVEVVEEEEGLRMARLPHAPWPLVSVIIPTRDRADLLAGCLRGLLEHTDYSPLEVIILDNGSQETATQRLFEGLADEPRVHVLPAPGPFNWGLLNNAGAAAARGDVLVLLNNDIEVSQPGWLKELVGQALRPEVGVVGATLLYPDRTLQHAGIAFGPKAMSGHIARGLPADAPGPWDRLKAVRAVSAVTGACLAIRRGVFEALGGIEQEGLTVTWSDADLCLKAEAAGYRVLITPFARLTHLEQATRGSDQTREAAVRYEAERSWMRSRWGARLDADPHFSLQVDAETGALRLFEPLN